MWSSAAFTCASDGATGLSRSRSVRRLSPASRAISRAGLPIRSLSRSASRSSVEITTI
jgi:hypothetical protein